ncbi:MAG: hypothetical protein BPH100C_192 [Phage 5P_2]|nr:MAG: hypothetical protein BPH100C_192 [Phage 5P_2]
MMRLSLFDEELALVFLPRRLTLLRLEAAEAGRRSGSGLRVRAAATEERRGLVPKRLGHFPLSAVEGRNLRLSTRFFGIQAACAARIPESRRMPGGTAQEGGLSENCEPKNDCEAGVGAVGGLDGLFAGGLCSAGWPGGGRSGRRRGRFRPSVGKRREPRERRYAAH